MGKEKDIEKIYELIEKFDFNELNKNDKSLVLSHMSAFEYTDMRSTILDTNSLFSKLPQKSKSVYRLSFKKIARYPVELYKVAAGIILLFGIGYVLSTIKPEQQKDLLSLVDTIYVKSIDTIFIDRTDTVEIIKEKIVYLENRNITEHHNLSQMQEEIVMQEYKRDCSKDICPEDVDLLGEIKTKGNLSGDSSLTEFIVALN